MNTAFTTYCIENNHGVVDYITDTDRAEALTKEGHKVTATCE
mgnify:CR=1 FL=1